MLPITPLDSSGKNGSLDILGYLLAVEYMLDEVGNEVTASTWEGSLAPKLGLEQGSEAKAEQMQCLAQAFSPDGKQTKLAENAGPDHKPGHDMTFNTPKSVGVAIAAAMARGDLKSSKELVDCCKRAVVSTLKKLEEDGIIECKRGDAGVDYHASEGLLCSVHTHLANRNLEPHLHFHALLYNVGFAEGKWGGIETATLYDNRFSTDKIFLAEIAKNLKEAGYGIRKKYGVDGLGKQTGVDGFDIAGIPQHLLDRFSTRHQEVEEYLKQNPGAKDAAIKTRKHKDEPTLAEMIASWREDFELFEKQRAGSVPDFTKLKGQADDIAPISAEEVFEKLHKNEAVITRNSLLARIAMEHPEKGIEGVMDEFENFKKHAEVVDVAPAKPPGLRTKLPKLKFKQQRWTTKGMLQKEADTLSMAMNHSKDTQHVLDKEMVMAHVAKLNEKFQKKDPNAKLAEEQIHAILHGTTKEGSLQIIQGRAGTGKTVSSKVIADAYKEAGYKVLGGTTGWKAAGQLEEDSGASSEALAKILHKVKKGKAGLDEKTIMIVDEAGMVSTQDGHAVMKAVLEAGGKVILQGDYLQLQAVGAGGMMRTLMDTVGYAELKDIRRQTSEEDRKTAQMFYDRDGAKPGELDARAERELGMKRFKRLDDRGHLSRHDTEKEAVEALAKQFVKNPKPVEDKLVLALDNNDAKTINKRIHDMRKKAGELGTAQYKIRTQTKFGVEDINLSKGDRIVFKEPTRFGAQNGDVGTILSIRLDRNGVHEFEVKLDGLKKGKERIVKFDESKCQNYGYGYAVTNHAAQGLTSKDVLMLANPKMVNEQSALVAFTRMKDNFKLYMSKDSEEQIAAKFGKQSLHEVAIEQGAKPKANSKLARTLKLVTEQAEKSRQARAVKPKNTKPTQPTPKPKPLHGLKQHQIPMVTAYIKQRWETLKGAKANPPGAGVKAVATPKGPQPTKPKHK